MKKTFGIFTLAMVCCAGAFAVEGVEAPSIVESREENIFLGKDAIQEIRKDYSQGKYDPFIQVMDNAYNKVVENNQILEFAKLREREAPSPEMIAKIDALHRERAEKIVQALGSEDTLFSQKVRSAILNGASFEGADFFTELHNKSLSSGKNADENRLIEIDVEYDYKVTHLAAMDPVSVRQQYYVLKMEQMDKMALAAQSFKDENLKRFVANMQSNFDQKLAQSWDLVDLYALMRVYTPSAGSVEGKVVAALQEHQERLLELEARD